jgi:Histidine kinase-, DNA gyrase B-, and HSP90-like ATPase
MNTKIVDITPDPKILSVLGEIEFKPWQCIAELVDNSVDGFLRMERAGAPIDTPTVQVAFGRDTVTVKDNGPGMSLDALENAVKAGWTSNDRFGSLGLYGVGFNIATARLGTLTTIWTTQAGDDIWYGLEIDLQKLKNFKIEVKTRSKSDALLSGTEVEVKKIKPDWKELIVNSSWLRSHITDRLSSIYGTMLRDANPQPIKFSLYVNNKKVSAWEHCTWPMDWEKYRKEEGFVRPIQEIDITFGEKYASQSTGEMYDTKEEYIREGINESDIVVMPERVYGWIGIQRYADEKEYGIDILRNGRKIEVLCKDLFDWEQPDGETRHEYPIDDPRQRGRIVGELHLDHGYVHYTKHRFEREHSSWKQLLKAVRHDEPLTSRERLGYPGVNASPLGVLFRAFRRNSPSTGQKWEDILSIRDNEKAKGWAKEYRKGNLQYRDDQRWLEELRKSDEVELKGRDL